MVAQKEASVPSRDKHKLSLTATTTIDALDCLSRARQGLFADIAYDDIDISHNRRALLLGEWNVRVVSHYFSESYLIVGW